MGVSNNKYIVDEMALKAGHEVISLPVAHCTLKPIELVWAQVKSHIKGNTSKFTLNEVAKEGFEVVTKERWADLVKHMRDKLEDCCWQNDNLYLDVYLSLSFMSARVYNRGKRVSYSLYYLTATLCNC